MMPHKWSPTENALYVKGFVTLTFRLNLFYNDQFTLSTQLIKPNFRVSLPHRCSTRVSLETNQPFIPFLTLIIVCSAFQQHVNSVVQNLTISFIFYCHNYHSRHLRKKGYFTQRVMFVGCNRCILSILVFKSPLFVVIIMIDGSVKCKHYM